MLFLVCTDVFFVPQHALSFGKISRVLENKMYAWLPGGILYLNELSLVNHRIYMNNYLSHMWLQVTENPPQSGLSSNEIHWLACP